MAAGRSKHDKSDADSKKKETKTLCCRARDASVDAEPAQVTRFIPHPNPPGTNGLGVYHVSSLTPSDVLELHDMVPLPAISHEMEQADDADASSKSTTRTSVVKLIKRKLSRASTIFKQSPTNHASTSKITPTKNNNADEGELPASTDPLAMSFDPDARTIISPDIMHHDLEDEEDSVSGQTRRGQAGTSGIEEIIPRVVCAGEEHLSTYSSTSATHKTLMEEEQKHDLREDALGTPDEGHSPTLQAHDQSRAAYTPPEAVYIRVEPPADGLFHGKLSFEDTVEIPKTRSASRMSEIALAVDHCFSSSSEYSERMTNNLDTSISAQRDQPDQVLRASLPNRGLDVDLPRRQPSDASVHLQHMRISQHLRSLSTLSFDSEDLPGHHRTSSGFESVKVPSSWGKVIGPLEASDEARISENVRTIFPTSRDASQNSHTKIAQSQARFVYKPLSMNVDGPFDQHLEVERPASLAPPTAQSGRSIGTNYDETASMWERALTTHQEDKLNPSRTRWSSFSNVSRRSSQRGRESGETQRTDSIGTTGLADAPQNGQTPIMLKRVNTTLSYDRLQLPIVRTGSISHPVSFEDDQRGARRFTMNTTVAGRQRSVSSPAPFDARDIAADHGPTQQLLVPSGAESGVVTPNIILSKPTGDDSSSLAPSSFRGPFDHLAPSERPWARYLSEDRELRNGPASAATGDDVIVRDFQPETSESPSSVTKMDRLRIKEKAKLRATTIVLKRKLLTDLPSVFKSNATFRRREHGHRSSISTGGILEYPELELLPPSAPRLPTALDTSHFVTPPRHTTRSHRRHISAKQSLSTPSAADPIPLKSSHEQERVIQEASAICLKRSSSVLARSYQEHIQSDFRKGSESVSPLDGQVDDI